MYPDRRLSLPFSLLFLSFCALPLAGQVPTETISIRVSEGTILGFDLSPDGQSFVFWQIPIGVHVELEQLVAAGLPPMQAIHAGSGAAARVLGAERDLGTIEVGKWADLVILDADPLADIRNTRRIWQVVHFGHVVDRPGILQTMRPR